MYFIANKEFMFIIKILLNIKYEMSIAKKL